MELSIQWSPTNIQAGIGSSRHGQNVCSCMETLTNFCVVHIGGLTCSEIGLWYLGVALFACPNSENSHDLANWEVLKV